LGNPYTCYLDIIGVGGRWVVFECGDDPEQSEEGGEGEGGGEEEGLKGG